MAENTFIDELTDNIGESLGIQPDTIDTVQRIFSLIGGAALAYKGVRDLRNDTVQGVGFLAAGGALLYRGISGRPVHRLLGNDTDRAEETLKDIAV